MSNIVFDFDGTIADSFEYVLGFLAEQAKRKLPLNEEERRILQGIPMATMARWLRISWWRLPLLLWRGRSAMGAHITTVHPFPGMKEVIEQLHQDGHQLFVVSSNSVQNIHIFLENNQMSKDFVKVYGGIGVLGKARVLRKLMRHNGLQLRDTLYIGDEVRDVVAARRARIDTIAVTWGYCNEVALEEYAPLAIVSEPRQILKAVCEAHEKV